MAFIYTLAILTSAFLLFLVEPMFARMLLPLLGGSPEVWNTAVVFYQVALLIGYLYAHVSIRLLGPAPQAILHLPLLALPVLVLPLAIPPGTLPPVQTSPIGWLLVLLLARLGLPFIILSATSPLVQRWFSQLPHPSAADPYFLYAASNVGSLAALLSYPLLIEPRLGLAAQSRYWTWGYGLCVGLLAICAIILWRRGGVVPSEPAEAPPPTPHVQVQWKRRLRWLAVAAIPSGLMLSVTTYLSTDIPPVPLLWVIPLALYLLAFSLAFSRKRIVPAAFLRVALPVSLLAVPLTIPLSTALPVWFALAVHLVAFFLIALKCDMALADDRPPASQLTDFYLVLSLGGALGGILNTLVAPAIFPLPLEYPLWLAAFAVLFMLGDETGVRYWKHVLIPAGIAFIFVPVGLVVRLRLQVQVLPVVSGLVFGLPALLALGLRHRRGFLAVRGIVFFSIALLYAGNQGDVLQVVRSFYGINRVAVEVDTQRHQLVHGLTLHGTQNRGVGPTCEPLTYYYPTGPIGHVFASWVGDAQDTRIGVVGLGAGSLAGYAQPGQKWVFYEIDPAVEAIARKPDYFTYLSECSSDVEVVLGDARLSLGREEPSIHDLLILDAYSSDAIPVHLITREALQLYLDRLAPGGLLAFHVSNKFFDLEPVLGALAKDLNLVTLLCRDLSISQEELEAGKSPSIWILLARSTSDFGVLAADPLWRPLPDNRAFPVWTDDYSAVLLALRH